MNHRSFLQGATALFASLVAGPTQIGGPVSEYVSRFGLFMETINAEGAHRWRNQVLGEPFSPRSDNALAWAHYYIDTEEFDRGLHGAWNAVVPNRWHPFPPASRVADRFAGWKMHRLSHGSRKDLNAKKGALRWVEHHFTHDADAATLRAEAKSYFGPITIQEVT